MFSLFRPCSLPLYRPYHYYPFSPRPIRSLCSPNPLPVDCLVFSVFSLFSILSIIYCLCIISLL